MLRHPIVNKEAGFPVEPNGVAQGKGVKENRFYVLVNLCETINPAVPIFIVPCLPFHRVLRRAQKLSLSLS